MPPRTTEQQIAELEARLARLRDRRRAADTGQKVVVGGAVIAAARRDPEIARWVVQTLRSDVTRKADVDRLADLLTELEAKAATLNNRVGNG